MGSDVRLTSNGKVELSIPNCGLRVGWRSIGCGTLVWGLKGLTSELGSPNNLCYLQPIAYPSLALGFIFCEINGNAKKKNIFF